MTGFEIVAYGAFMLAIGYGACFLVHKTPDGPPVLTDQPVPSVPWSEREPFAIEQDPQKEAAKEPEFVVSGKPKRNWRQRKKELQAASKTKRKAREEWRD